jgi:hypothetical protein
VDGAEFEEGKAREGLCLERDTRSRSDRVALETVSIEGDGEESLLQQDALLLLSLSHLGECNESGDGGSLVLLQTGDLADDTPKLVVTIL